MAVTIYHNPRCSKSRQTLELLEARGLEPEVVDYLKTPPDAAAIERILTLLGLEPRALMRIKETAYRDNHLDDPGLTRQQLIDALVRHPQLLERPVVVANGKAAIGRPPENVLEIL
ncbi:MAG: arsenate reductase (glutaredoxin) [Magnetococcales bacterium]|nr:arsenate reductase (glutaredoxin) [Magnetococcales bacterium]